MVIRTILSVLLGAVLGFAWYRFVGCRGGTCFIGANPFVSTIYGGLIGYVLSSGGR